MGDRGSAIEHMEASHLAASIFRSHYFPEDLVPLEEMASFSISGGSKLEIELHTPVQRKVNGRAFWFAQKITAEITLSRISNVKGVQFRQLMVWLPVDTIQMTWRDSKDGMVQFFAGPACESIPAPAFPEPSFISCYSLPQGGRERELKMLRSF